MTKTNLEKQDLLFIDPEELKEPTTFYLDKSKSSWLTISHLQDTMKKQALEEFEIYWQEHPERKSKILMYNKEQSAHRFYKSYLNTPKLNCEVIKYRSYMFGDHESSKETPIDFPECFRIFFDFLNAENINYNQSVVNWYQNGNDYLPFHKDWELGKKEGSDVATITLNKVDDGNCRFFEVLPLDKGIDAEYAKVRVLTRHGIILRMGGECQQKFKHGLPKMPEHGYPRISLTFRNFD